MRFALPCVIAVLFAPQGLAEKVAIVSFTGPGANAVRSQLVYELCDRADCVPQAKVTTKGRVDWKKVKKEGVKFVLEGKVLAKGKKKTIQLQVFARAGAGKKKSFALEDGELGQRNLKAAAEVLGQLLGLPPKELPEEKKPPPEDPSPEQKVASVEKPPKEEETKGSAPPPPPKEVEPPKEEAPPVAPQGRAKRPVIAAEVGVDVVSKSFGYAQVITPNLRSYRAPFIVGPSLKAELYPLALVHDGALSGLGAEVGYFVAVGLKSRRTGTFVSYPTSISRFDLGLKFQIRPSNQSDAYVSPIIGYRAHSFSVGPGSDMSELVGLPAIRYRALKLGIEAQLPFGDTGLLVFGRFAVLPVLSAPEIIGAKYFANGAVLGIDLALGLGFKLPFWNLLQLRLAFDFARYGLSFRTEATDIYVAEGAVDLYLGGALGVRFTY